jgi:hypothetical protein
MNGQKNPAGGMAREAIRAGGAYASFQQVRHAR